jgi:hypothetical protein
MCWLRGHWSDRHFTKQELEQSFRRVVDAARNFEEANGVVSQQFKTEGGPLISLLHDDELHRECREASEVPRGD